MGNPETSCTASGQPEAAAGVREKISKEAINALPLFHYNGRVTLVRNEDTLIQSVAKLRSGSGNGPVVLGFDTETRPSFQKGKSYTPSLVQLASADEVFLFHLKWMPLDARLVGLLEDPAIIKTGVAVHDDMRFLARLHPFIPQSVVDLSEIARGNHLENRGLRGLAAAFLRLRISKGEQCSNWGNSELSPRQIRYAATDAWISRAVYLSMKEAGLDFDPAPLPPSKPNSRSKTGVPRRRGRRHIRRPR